MKLLVITQKVNENDPILGFFCKWIEKFAKYFDKAEVIALEIGKYNLPVNVSLHSLGKEQGYGKLRCILQLAAYSLQLKYDFVFVHMNPEYIALFGWYWKLRGKRTALWYTHKSVTWWLRVAEKFADKIFTASRESFRLPSKKVEIIGHGIDTEIFKPKSITYNLQPITAKRDPVRGTNYALLSVGRITPSKDLETILLAIKRLSDEDIKVTLDIVGVPVVDADFEYEKTLRELVRSLHLENNINFLGPKNYQEMPAIYTSHDLLVHTSKTGSVDKVVLESLACGTPAISSSEAFHDLPEYLRFKENDANDLAQKIRNFFDTKPDISKLIESARANNDLDKLIQRIVEHLKANS